MKRILPVFIILLSLVLLIPGVTQPILSISGTIDKSELTMAGVEHLANSFSDDSAGSGSARGMISMISGMLGLNEIEGEVEVFQKTRSIWGTIEELYRAGNAPVSALVMLFSVVIPALKLSLMLLLQFSVPEKVELRLNRFIALISKWSMADVFVVALMISFMAGNASAGMGELLRTTANFEVGFYYFTAYCIFSVFSTYLVSHTDRVKAVDEERRVAVMDVQ
ncbi:paraquat-inducible protein A [Shewanella atlantica]|uniref:Paraquat-inducible protein A n=1 Tax=Shewanella atlantica TaxID=271099 RepID=A0A3S0RGN5_9GAMM|nr:paraquat-inducible protein A [Shewanella atlantica]RTR27929.1 paraquat-inducible protein A [Shewanella atlantica]